MASGEMSDREFRSFLSRAITQLLPCLPKGGIAMICMDWRHVEELIAAGKGCGLELINLCVWNKTNGGMGSLYRSKHELVCVFRKPGAPHINNVEVGRHWSQPHQCLGLCRGQQLWGSPRGRPGRLSDRQADGADG